MKRLKEARFITDVSIARKVFSITNNGLTLEWRSSKRELIYFLLHVFGARTYNSETLTEIAFKLFRFKTKKQETARKNFTTQIPVMESKKSDIHLKRKGYRIIRDIFMSENLN